MCTLSKIMHICYKSIFFTGRSLFTRDRKVDTWPYPRTLVCYSRFHIFIVNLYKYQNVFKSIPANIVNGLWKTILMPNYYPSRSVLRWLSVVRNRGVNQYLVLSVYCWHVFFVLVFFISLMCLIEKNYCIGYLYT